MTLFVDDPDFTLYVGDALDVLRGMPDESVHCCVTSPPYLGLRDYGMDKQIGLEAGIDEYVTTLVGVFAEVRRILRRDGTLWLNLGDSFNAYNGGAGPSSSLSQTQTKARPRLSTGFGLQQKELKPKDLMGIPWRVALAHQADGWYLRSDIIWAKPNPMPESVTDRPTKSHEYVFLLTREARYFYDADAIREDAQWRRWGTQDAGKYADAPSPGRFIQALSKEEILERFGGGRNARSVWEIATQPYAEAHFATFPEELPRRCIAAGTSERGCCPVCGAPWEREISESPNLHPGDSGRNDLQGPVQRVQREDGKAIGTIMRERHEAGRERTTTGWRPTCDCARGEPSRHLEPTACVVLDPFAGSGTVALVARRLGRRSIGIELSPEYAELCARRLQQQSLFAGEPA